MNLPWMGYTVSFVKDKNKASSPQSYPICHTSHRPARELHNLTLAPAHLRVLIQDYFLKRRSSYFEIFQTHEHRQWKLHTGPMSFWPIYPMYSLLHYQHLLSKESGPFLPIDEPAWLHHHLYSPLFTLEFILAIYVTDLDKSQKLS